MSRLIVFLTWNRDIFYDSGPLIHFQKTLTFSKKFILLWKRNKTIDFKMIITDNSENFIFQFQIICFFFNFS